MDSELQNSWKDASPPFDGVILSLSDLIDISTLRANLVEVVSFLRKQFSSEDLNVFDDWHEHDGFISECKPTSWDLLDEYLQSNESLYESRHGDAYVRRAFYPHSKSFLLRYYVLEEDEDPTEYPGIWGDLDVSLPRPLMDKLTNSQPQFLHNAFTIAQAKEYFDNSYAG